MSLSLDRTGRKANAFQLVFSGLGLALLLLNLLLDVLDFLFLLAHQSFQLGDVTPVLDGSPPGRAHLCLDLLLGETTDFFLQNACDIGHDMHSGSDSDDWGIWAFYP